jgi:hypothetical protein
VKVIKHFDPVKTIGEVPRGVVFFVGQSDQALMRPEPHHGLSVPLGMCSVINLEDGAMLFLNADLVAIIHSKAELHITR